MKNLLLATTLIATCAFGTLVQGAEPRVQVLPAPEDATKKSVLVGRNLADNMIVTFEIEAAKDMWLHTGNPPKLRQRPVRKGEIYHLDVKPLDPKSNAVISYEHVTYRLLNRTTGRKMSGVLHPMWDNGGLHYAANSPLAGDGAYELTVSVGVPSFGRAAEYKELWLKPIATKFHFKIVDGKIMEVSEPMVEARKHGESRATP
jgi:hypothetical protein